MKGIRRLWGWLTTPPVKLVLWLLGALQGIKRDWDEPILPEQRKAYVVPERCGCPKHNRYVVRTVGGKREGRCPVCYGKL